MNLKNLVRIGFLTVICANNAQATDDLYQSAIKVRDEVVALSSLNPRSLAKQGAMKQAKEDIERFARDIEKCGVQRSLYTAPVSEAMNILSEPLDSDEYMEMLTSKGTSTSVKESLNRLWAIRNQLTSTLLLIDGDRCVGSVDSETN